MKPSSKAIQEALQDVLGLPEPPKRIECFDISHIQGTDKVASMVVWEDGRMKKSDYRKFIIRTVVGNDDFASMREVVTRRYSRLQQENKPFPSLILIDGGLGQLHAAAEALEAIGVINQPLASIAKREEIIYVYGQEDEPIQLDHYSPVLHLIQTVRDEAHRFAVTFHRNRRSAARLTSELEQVEGVGSKTIAQTAARVRQPGARPPSLAGGAGEGGRSGRGAPVTGILQRAGRRPGTESTKLNRRYAVRTRSIADPLPARQRGSPKELVMRGAY